MVRLRFTTTATILVLTAAAACTVHKQEAPSLTGPSELGTSIVVQVSPDVLAQDGASQSLVTITARDANGQPKGNLALRADVSVNGTIVEGTLGTLSARSVTTDGSGHATLTYTAPALPQGVPVPAGTVQIEVTPVGSDFGNSTSRTASVRLILPPGVGGVPPCTINPNLKITLTPSAPTDHQDVIFDASFATAPSASIVSYVWQFSDGGSGSGRTTQHAFDSPGSASATVTATDAVGSSVCNSVAFTVAQGQGPTAAFVVSPSTPLPNQQVFFNAASSKPSSGRTITSYRWDFGDGTSGSGVQTSHTYSVTGGYSVTLTVTDDAGNVGTVTQSVTIGIDSPTADFSFSPTAPTAGSFVNFNGGASQAVAGRTISTYTWNFGDGGTATGATPTHAFAAGGTYNVTLTVVDSQGKSASVTKAVTVS
jgi:PKD repeat protein